MIQKSPGVPVSPAEAIGPAFAWLVQAPEATQLLSKRVNLPALTYKYGLLPGWDGPGTPIRRRDDFRTTVRWRGSQCGRSS